VKHSIAIHADDLDSVVRAAARLDCDLGIVVSIGFEDESKLALPHPM
jgi:hypothetical protein